AIAARRGDDAVDHLLGGIHQRVAAIGDARADVVGDCVADVELAQPVPDTPQRASAQVPAPITGESPMRPHFLLVMPPVLVAAAMWPWRSSATAPTVPKYWPCGASPT